MEEGGMVLLDQVKFKRRGADMKLCDV